MDGAATDTDWLRSIGALTVERDGDASSCEVSGHPADPILAARLCVSRLVAAASAVAATPQALACCPPAAAALVAELTAGATPASRGHGAPRPDRLVRAYLDALRDAAMAVYFCRRVEHASNHCWFSPAGPAADLCGRVLDAGHRCAAAG